MAPSEGDPTSATPGSRAGEAHARLSASLEAALVRELRDEYTRLNALLFEGLLRPPLLVLSEAEGRLGRFDADRRTLELGRALVLGEAWPVVLEVLKHEMAHQYVPPPTRRAPRARRACSSASRGCSPSPRARASTRPRPR